MQHVSAFSRPQTVPAAPALAAGRKPGLWILDSWRDLILYVCTPLLLVPIFIGAQGLWAAEDIYLFVAAVGAMGHHLPGMIRAYDGIATTSWPVCSWAWPYSKCFTTCNTSR
jgi:hypothetical protein